MFGNEYDSHGLMTTFLLVFTFLFDSAKEKNYGWLGCIVWLLHVALGIYSTVRCSSGWVVGHVMLSWLSARKCIFWLLGHPFIILAGFSRAECLVFMILLFEWHNDLVHAQPGGVVPQMYELQKEWLGDPSQEKPGWVPSSDAIVEFLYIFVQRCDGK
jgi:hypothetical protein